MNDKIQRSKFDIRHWVFIWYLAFVIWHSTVQIL